VSKKNGQAGCELSVGHRADPGNSCDLSGALPGGWRRFFFVEGKTVSDPGANRAELAWSASFQPDGLPTREAVTLLKGALTANCLALKQLLEG
jgi:hypothetical protein